MLHDAACEKNLATWAAMGLAGMPRRIQDNPDAYSAWYLAASYWSLVAGEGAFGGPGTQAAQAVQAVQAAQAALVAQAAARASHHEESEHFVSVP